MCRSPTRTVRERAQISRSLRCTRRSRWAEDMTNTFNYIPQKPRRILSESFIREHSASSRETRSSGTSSFLSCTLTTTVQWLSLDISEFYTKQSDCMYHQIYDWSRYAKIVWWCDTVSSNTKMEQKEWDGFAKKRSECNDATVIFSCTRILLINKAYICLRISLFIGIHFLLWGIRRKETIEKTENTENDCMEYCPKAQFGLVFESEAYFRSPILIVLLHFPSARLKRSLGVEEG